MSSLPIHTSVLCISALSSLLFPHLLVKVGFDLIMLKSIGHSVLSSCDPPSVLTIFYFWPDIFFICLSLTLFPLCICARIFVCYGIFEKLVRTTHTIILSYVMSSVHRFTVSFILLPLPFFLFLVSFCLFLLLSDLLPVIYSKCVLLQGMVFVTTCGSWRSEVCYVEIFVAIVSWSIGLAPSFSFFVFSCEGSRRISCL